MKSGSEGGKALTDSWVLMGWIACWMEVKTLPVNSDQDPFRAPQSRWFRLESNNQVQRFHWNPQKGQRCWQRGSCMHSRHGPHQIQFVSQPNSGSAQIVEYKWWMIVSRSNNECLCQKATQSLSALAEADMCVEVLGKALQGFFRPVRFFLLVC